TLAGTADCPPALHTCPQGYGAPERPTAPPSPGRRPTPAAAPPGPRCSPGLSHATHDHPDRCGFARSCGTHFPRSALAAFGSHPRPIGAGELPHIVLELAGPRAKKR